MCHRQKMGVPDDMEGPPLKKCKLSLQSKRKEQNERPSYSHAEEPLSKPPSDIREFQPASNAPCSSIERYCKTDSDNSLAKSSAAPDLPVAPVATLHNLGNTCFLNCILQILRYTPNFLSGLASLKEKIQTLEDVLDKQDKADDILSSETRRTWRFVKDIHQMYKQMDEREAVYSRNPMSQSTHMAVRPSTVLNSMRELNPMFEGNYQHDAQELLRCLLCFMEDAEKDVQRIKDKDLMNDGINVEISSDFEVKMMKSQGENCTGSATKNVISGRCSAEGTDMERDEGRESEVVAPQNPKKPFKLKGGAPSNRTSRRIKAASKVTRAIKDNDDGENREKNKHLPISRLKQSDGVEERNGQDNIVAKITRGLKRKRSQQDGGDADQAVGGIEEKGGTKPLTSVLMNGVTATRKKIEGNGQSIVGFLRKVKDKLVPNPSKGTQKAVLKEEEMMDKTKVASSTLSGSGVTSELHPKPKKRMGMTGCVIRHDKAMTEKSPKSDCIIIEEDIPKDIPPGSGHFTSRNKKLDDVTESSSAGNFQGHQEPSSPAPHTSSITHTALSPTCGIPLSSADDEIAPASENDLPFNMESTIDSVTKRYYSSLSRRDLKWTSPSSSPQTLKTISEDTESGVGTTQNLGDSPRGSKPSPAVCSLTPGTDLIIHSPSPSHKTDVKCKDKSGSKQSKAKKALDFDLVGNSSDTQSSSVPVVDSQAFGEDVNLLDFLPKRARQVSESHSMKELKNNLLNLDTPGMTTRSTRSAPNTPDFKIATGKNENSQPKESSQSQVKSKLKICDRLGVSPVKTVSASSALRNLRSQQRKPLSCADTSTSRPKRNILPETSFSQDHISPRDEVANSVRLTTNKLEHPASCRKKLFGNPRCGSDNTAFGIKEGEKDTLDVSSSLTLSSGHVKPGSAKTHPYAAESKCDLRQGQGDSSGQMLVDVHCSSGLKLKQLSVSVDKCDWMLAKPESCPVSNNHNKMINGRIRRLRHKGKSRSQVRLGNSPCKIEKPVDHRVKINKAESNKMNLPLIERLFGGTMVHLTRCLECERGRERRESFLDISIAVRHLKEAESEDSHGEDDEDTTSPSPSCLASLISSSSSVERLRDSNKYWCEECLHHVEAERSCHYLDLPQILSLHLKRFSTNSGLFGGLSKLNDKVDIPEELPCLRQKCAHSCKEPTHRYQLFAIATHSGLSILHGHYRAFVKVQPSVNLHVFHNLVSYQTGSNNLDDTSGTSWATQTCSSMFASSECLQSSSLNHQSSQEEEYKLSGNERALSSVEQEDDSCQSNVQCPPSASPRSPRKVPRTYDKAMKEGNPFPTRRITDFFASAEQGSKDSTTNSVSSFASPTQMLSSSTAYTNVSSFNSNNSTRNLQSLKTEKTCGTPHISESTQGDMKNNSINTHVKQESMGLTMSDKSMDIKCSSCYWLECDDETVQVMGKEEFGKKLKEEDGALLGTPYLLFYHSQGLLPV